MVWTVPLGLTLGLVLLSLVRLPTVLPNNSIDTATRNAAYGVTVIAILALWAIYLGLALMHGRIL